MKRDEVLSYAIKAYNARSHVFTLIGRLENAYKDLNSIIRLSKGSNDEISAWIDKAHIAFLKGDKSECELFANKAILMARKKNVSALIGRANIPLSRVFHAKGQYDEAERLLQESIDIFTRHVKNNAMLLSAKRIYTHILSTKGKYDSAVEMLKDMRDNHWNDMSMHDQSSVITNLATCYSQMGYLDKAIELYNQSVEIKKILNDQPGLSICYYSLSFTYFTKSDYINAREYAVKSLDICEEMQDISGISYAYICLASISKKTGKYKEAIGFHEKSLKVGKPMNDLHMELSNYLDLGLLYSDTGKFNKALECINEMEKRMVKLENPYYVCALLKLKINYYKNKGEPDRIIVFAEKGLGISEKAKLMADYYFFMSCIVEYNPLSRKDLYDILLKDAYTSDNFSFSIISYPGLIKYNIATGTLEYALQLAQEYVNKTRDIEGSGLYPHALHLNCVVRKKMGKPYRKWLQLAITKAKQLQLKPLLEKLWLVPYGWCQVDSLTVLQNPKD